MVLSEKCIFNALSDQVIGQPSACEAVAKSVVIAEAGLNNPRKPKGSFLFLGPTGTGKTSLVRALASLLYPGNPERLAILNMADFQLQESIKSLLGDHRNPGGRLGQIIDTLNAMGGGIILFDEIEKSHRELVTVFLSALDTGTIQTSNGSTKSMHDIYLFFTSNLGSRHIAEMDHSHITTIQDIVFSAAIDFFGPEGFIRFKKAVVFNPLDFTAKMTIVKNMIQSQKMFIEGRLGLEIHMDEEPITHFIMDKGFHPTLGARPLEHAIEEHFSSCFLQPCIAGNSSSVFLKVCSDGIIAEIKSLNSRAS